MTTPFPPADEETVSRLRTSPAFRAGFAEIHLAAARESIDLALAQIAAGNASFAHQRLEARRAEIDRVRALLARADQPADAT
jgi:hypothetical protein